MSKYRYTPLNKRFDDLANCVDIQANEPSVEYDEYMLGMFNGLELGLAIMKDREPNFKRIEKKSKIRKLFDWLKLKVNPKGGE
jgi:hypothetical protein